MPEDVQIIFQNQTVSTEIRTGRKLLERDYIGIEIKLKPSTARDFGGIFDDAMEENALFGDHFVPIAAETFVTNDWPGHPIR